MPPTAAEILEEVLISPRRAFVALPDLRVIERPGWLQIITPSFTHGGFNEVAHANLSADEADAVIDQTVAEYRALGIRFRWAVGPDSAPADLGERLARRGLVRSDLIGMARATDLATQAHPEITVEPVDATNVDVYTDTMARAWGVDPAPHARAHAVLLDDPTRRHRLYLARHRGAPAATAGAVLFPRSMYLLGGVVLPEVRGRGLYRALVAARLVDAAAAGIPLATSRANATTSAPILAHLGFAAIAQLASYAG